MSDYKLNRACPANLKLLSDQINAELGLPADASEQGCMHIQTTSVYNNRLAFKLVATTTNTSGDRVTKDVLPQMTMDALQSNMKSFLLGIKLGKAKYDRRSN